MGNELFTIYTFVVTL